MNKMYQPRSFQGYCLRCAERRVAEDFVRKLGAIGVELAAWTIVAGVAILVWRVLT